jgi:hypothetical protein
MKDKTNLIPTQKTGAESDTSEEVILNTLNEAIEHFKIVKRRLLNVSEWHSISGKASADFTLTDYKGNAVDRLAREGDFFKIKIPAPENETGDGFDWAQVQSIEELSTSENSELVAVTVKPASSPTNSDPETAHFFKDEASSIFLVKRDFKTITAGVHGRNEQPNTDVSIKDSIRNVFVALGAILGFSKAQWKSLVRGLVQTEDQNNN